VAVVAVAMLLGLNATGAMHTIHTHHEMLLGASEHNTRFAGIFGTGAIYYLFRDTIPLTNTGACVAATLLTALMFNRHLAETAYTIFGGDLILWLAFEVRVLRLSRIDNNADISYGLYLYGWPVQTLIIWNYLAINPWLLCLLSLLVARLMGYAGWVLVEKPCLQLKRRRPTTLALP
jgi:peptidoglycan/LPS O-acetylase OafA/YrhL